MADVITARGGHRHRAGTWGRRRPFLPYSCEVDQRTPYPAGCRDISHKLGVAAEECLYVWAMEVVLS